MKLLVFFSRGRRKAHYFDALASVADIYGEGQWQARQQSYLRLILSWQCVINPTVDGLSQQQVDDLAELYWAEKTNARSWHANRMLKTLLLGINRWITARLFAVFCHHLQHHHIDAIAVWNGLKYLDALMLLSAKHLGLPVNVFEVGLLPNSTVLDAKGINYGNSLSRDASRYRQYDKPCEPQKIVARAPTQFKSDTRSELPARYALVPFQLNRDSQVTLYSPWIKDMTMLFHSVCDIVDHYNKQQSHLSNDGDHSPLHVVFREHPSDKQDYSALKAQVKDAEYVHFNNSAALVDAVQQAEVVMTINSTVGLESMLLGTPVISLGQSFYNIDGLARHADNATALAEALNDVCSMSAPINTNAVTRLDEELLQGFICYLRNEYLLPGTWSVCDDAHMAAVWSRLHQHHNAHQPTSDTPLIQSD